MQWLYKLEVNINLFRYESIDLQGKEKRRTALLATVELPNWAIKAALLCRCDSLVKRN